MGRNREIGSAHSYLFTNLISVFGVYTKLETFSKYAKKYVNLPGHTPSPCLPRTISSTRLNAHFATFAPYPYNYRPHA